jgi:hypothetical protein
MRTSKILLTTAVCLAMTAMANAANKITALSYTITAPGTYELTSNLTCFVAANAITINVPVAGKVVLNLNGFAVLWDPNMGAGEFTTVSPS